MLTKRHSADSILVMLRDSGKRIDLAIDDLRDALITERLNRYYTLARLETFTL